MSSMTPAGLPEDLRAKFAAIRRAQSSSKFVTVVLIVLIVIEFGMFAFSTINPIKEGFRDDKKVQAAVESAMPEVQPVLFDTMSKMVRDVAPEYRRLATERYSRVRDSLGEKVAAKFNQIPDDAEKALGGELTGTFDRVIKRLEPEIKTAFPALSDQQRQDMLLAQFDAVVAKKNAELAAKIDTIRTAEMLRMKAVLDSFALPPDGTVAKDGQIEKEFERVVLLLANAEIQDRIEGLNQELGKPK